MQGQLKEINSDIISELLSRWYLFVYACNIAQYESIQTNQRHILKNKIKYFRLRLYYEVRKRAYRDLRQWTMYVSFSLRKSVGGWA